MSQFVLELSRFDSHPQQIRQRGAGVHFGHLALGGRAHIGRVSDVDGQSCFQWLGPRLRCVQCLRCVLKPDPCRASAFGLSEVLQLREVLLSLGELDPRRSVSRVHHVHDLCRRRGARVRRGLPDHPLRFELLRLGWICRL